MDKGISENKFIEIHDSDVKITCCYHGRDSRRNKILKKEKENKSNKEKLSLVSIHQE